VRVRGVYFWKHANARWEDSDRVARYHLLPHFLLGYLRKLRDAYDACPSAYHTPLFNQIDYVVSRAATRHSSTAILPALAWENRYRITQGMEQGEMAAFLASAANTYAAHGAREAPGTMRYAFQAIEPLFIRVGTFTGGVRSVVQDKCGAKIARFRPCFWFHSRGVGIDTKGEGEPAIGTVLNQHLHVISSILDMSIDVNKRHELIPVEWGTAENALARLKDRAIGGLYQLAFSRGNNSAARNRPPSLAQFMRHETKAPVLFYFSYYRFDLPTRTFADISKEATCHYHTHSLEKFQHIMETLNNHSGFFAAHDGWRLYEAMGRLLAGGSEPIGQFASTAALWQFYLSQGIKYTIAGCPPCNPNSGASRNPCSVDESVEAFYRALWP
jgi:hypothetical protein